jgi:hypothetical protein
MGKIPAKNSDLRRLYAFLKKQKTDGVQIEYSKAHPEVSLVFYSRNGDGQANLPESATIRLTNGHFFAQYIGKTSLTEKTFKDEQGDEIYLAFREQFNNSPNGNLEVLEKDDLNFVQSKAFMCTLLGRFSAR